MKTVKAQYLSTKTGPVSLALIRTSDYFIYDWSNLTFVKSGAVKPNFTLFLHSPDLFVGDVQLWTLTFDTTNMADDFYFMVYLNADGSVISPTYREYFYLVNGLVSYPQLL